MRLPDDHPLDADDVFDIEPGLADLVGQLVGVVEEGGREPRRAVGRVAVLTVAQVAFDDGAEPRIEQLAFRQTREQRGEPADGGDEDRAAGPYDPARLAEGEQTVLASGEVVERAEHEHGVVVPVRRPSRRASPSSAVIVPARVDRLLDVGRDRVDDVDPVAVGRQPLGVDAGPTPDVENAEGAGRQVAADDLPGAQQLESAPVAPKASGLVGSLVVGDNLVRRPGAPFGQRSRGAT